MDSRFTYHVLADTFSNEEVSVCFVLLGDANMHWATALSESSCRFIYVRDEHCAVAAAMSWARSTGRVGVASVTCGPGVTQILTALPAAVQAGIPLVVFAGEAPLNKPWHNQGIDQRPFVEACGAHYVSVHNSDTLTVQVRDAFLHAQLNRHPVVLGVPIDLQTSRWSGSLDMPQASHQLVPRIPPILPNESSLRAAVQLIRNAQRIVIMAGRGAMEAGAGPACQALAEDIDALLATTLPARGLFHQDPFCIGIAGGFSTALGRRCLQAADLIIAVGARLALHNSDNGALFDAAHVLHVDISPRRVSQGRLAACHHMQCDAKLGIEALRTALGASPQPSRGSNQPGYDSWRTPELASEIKTRPADDQEIDIEPELLDPRDVVSMLDTTLPQEWYTVNSSGHCSFFFAQMPRRPGARFLTIREFGAIGNGISFAVGVAAAHPQDIVVLFDGDGGALMHIQELETIRRHGMKILICIMNDGAYGSEIHKLRAEGLADTGAVFGRPDFAKIAQGFGLDGVRVDDLASLQELVQQFAAQERAAVWDFHVSDRVMSPVVRRSHGIASQ